MFRNKSLILILMLAVFAAFYLINCDKDSGTESKTGGNGTPGPVEPDTIDAQDLLGRWEVTNISVDLLNRSGPPSAFADLGMPDTIFITFNADSTNEIELIYTDSTETAYGTWSVSGDTLTATLPLIQGSETVSGPCSLSEDKNTLTYSATVPLIIPPATEPFPLEVELQLARREN